MGVLRTVSCPPTIPAIYLLQLTSPSPLLPRFPNPLPGVAPRVIAALSGHPALAQGKSQKEVLGMLLSEQEVGAVHKAA